jgi:hypothetical protein
MTELKALHLQDNQPDPGFSRRRKRLGVLPVQRLVLLQRPLRSAGQSGHPYRHPFRSGHQPARPARRLPRLSCRQLVTAPCRPGSATRTKTAPGKCCARSSNVPTVRWIAGGGRGRRPKSCAGWPFAKARTGSGGWATTTRHNR